jgi:hypothetical protein
VPVITPSIGNHKKRKPRMKFPNLCTFAFQTLAAGLLALALTSNPAKATPYASSITSDGSGHITFYLNEGGGNVTITYEDNSVDATFNGAVRAAGAYTFSMGSHTSFSIQVSKTGSGVPTLISSSPAFTPRGIDVNGRPASPYFGRIYAAKVNSPNGIYAFNPDFSVAAGPTSAGIGFQAGNPYEPYRISVADDDYVMVGDAGYDNAGTTTLQDGVWRVNPTLSSSQLFLGPAGYTAGSGVHATPNSRPIVIGNVQAGGPVTLLDVDGDFVATHGYNSLLVYTNITLAALPWQTPPDVQGPEVGLNISSRTLGGNPFPGLHVHGNYIYASTYRGNYSNPNLQIYTNDIGNGDTLALVWDSITADGGTIGTGPDFYSNVSDPNGANNDHTVEIGVSPDGNYVACLIRKNWFMITPLTNGIPDTSRIFKSTPTSGTTIARGMAWDAADNLYLSSSGLGLCQSWSLGQTSIATTRGNSTGSTGFALTVPTAHCTAAATTPNASQGGNNGSAGTPVPAVFTITRTDVNGFGTPLAVNFTLGGTAPAAAYTVSAGTPGVGGTVVIPETQASVTVTITPTTANVPRPTTTVLLSVTGGAYIVDQPSQATALIQNTSSNQLIVNTDAATMYKAFASDYANVIVTRIGDTNAPSYTTAPFAYSGSGAANVDFTPLSAITFNPGDLSYTNPISPLSNGVPPVDVANPAYTGNKSIIVTLPASGSYLSVAPSNSASLMLIDNAEPPSAVLFSDPLTDAADASNWGITYASGNLTQEPADYTVDFGYDLSANNPLSFQNGLIGAPPNGATNALRIACNNSGATYAGGVNLYYTNRAFSGNYAVRFNMNLVASDNSFAIAGPLFGINHNGIETNWWLSTTANYEPHNWASDGVWYWVSAAPGGIGGFAATEFQEYTGLGGALPNTGWQNPANVASMPAVFKHSVFSAPGGSSGGTPANNSPVSANPADNSWADVEIKQINNLVTMSIDKTAIFVYTNTTTFTNGYLMLGYNSPIGGAFNNYIATPDASVYISNLRVVSLAPPLINSITDSKSGTDNNVTIIFTSNDGDASPASFALQGAAGVTGPYADVTATITQLPPVSGAAVFQATTTSTAGAQFYRIRQK